MDRIKIAKYFNYEHLPKRLQDVSRPFGELAENLVKQCEDGRADYDETQVALRKLLEAKDAAVRAAL